MGIDAEMFVKFRRAEAPTEDELTRWSWDMACALGAENFYTRKGLALAQYREAERAWREAFDSHPLAEEYREARANANDERAARTGGRTPTEANADEWHVRKQRITDLGEKIRESLPEYPEARRRVLELSNSVYPIEAEEMGEYLGTPYYVPPEWQRPGCAWTQDGEPILATLNPPLQREWFIEVNLFGRYYGKGYERGDLLSYCAVAEYLEMILGPKSNGLSVYYGGDSSGVCAELFDEYARSALKCHLFGELGRAYFHGSAFGDRDYPTPQPCSLCIPGEPRFDHYGSGGGGNYSAVSCRGCGESFETRDGGKTWSKPSKEGF